MTTLLIVISVLLLIVIALATLGPRADGVIHETSGVAPTSAT
jgi:hypothetical protein